MSTPSAKRSLFQTPVRSRKKQRTGGKKQSSTMKIPRSLLPETKLYSRSTLANYGLSNLSYSSIPQDMNQGDDGEDFLGSKFRITRMRVYYDFSQSTLTSGVRIAVVIPRNPSSAPVNALSTSTTPINTREYTVLHDMLLPDAAETAAGTFDVTGPINVEMSNTGTTALRNNVWLLIWSNSIDLTSSCSYQVWFTDA